MFFRCGSHAPVMRVSTDNGATFGPMQVLATNGTIDEAAEEEQEEKSENLLKKHQLKFPDNDYSSNRIMNK